MRAGAEQMKGNQGNEIVSKNTCSTKEGAWVEFWDRKRCKVGHTHHFHGRWTSLVFSWKMDLTCLRHCLCTYLVDFQSHKQTDQDGPYITG